jgi:GTPase SAR1 family protein
MLEGLLELRDLNLYGNKVSAIVVPHNPKLLTKLETLNLGYNDLAYIPEELDRLKALRTLKVMNNFLEKIPMRVCDMELKTIDVSSNPVIQPPIETCERGICSMKRYYQCLRMEEQSKQKAMEALQSKAACQSKKPIKGKKVGGVGLNFNLSKPKRLIQVSLGRKTSDDSNASPLNESFSSATTPQNEQMSSQPQKLSPIHQRPSTHPSMPPLPTRSVSMPPEQLVSADPGAPPSSILPLNTKDIRPKSQSMSAVPDTPLIDATSVIEPAKAPQRLDSLGKSVENSRLPSWSESHMHAVDTDDGTKQKAYLHDRVDSNISSASAELTMEERMLRDEIDQVTVNDTLKVIFVGMAMAGKTSMIKRLIEGENAVIPKRDERTVGVDIYEWDPKIDKRFEHIDNRIQLQDKELEELCGDVNVKFSVWDFAGQHVYHATHELFFSQRALYVLVWDMGATNPATKQRKNLEDDDNSGGAFRLGYDSDGSNSDDYDDFISEEEARRADRALERDIDEKVQFWVDCIQSSAPGAAILPVASFNDLFEDNDHQEAKRRCDMLKQRLLVHEKRRLLGIEDRLKQYETQNRANDEAALRLRKLLGSYTRPKIIFGNDGEDSIVRVSGTKYTGFANLTQRIIDIATGRDKANFRYPIFRGHVGARIPRMRLEVREAVRRMRDRFKVVEWGYFINELRGMGLSSVEDISDALHFLTNIGELSYFGGVLPDKGQRTRLLDDSNVRILGPRNEHLGKGPELLIGCVVAHLLPSYSYSLLQIQQKRDRRLRRMKKFPQ